jgi:hypothetical protein
MDNITALREMGDGPTIIFTMLFIFVTCILIIIEEQISNK